MGCDAMNIAVGPWVAAAFLLLLLSPAEAQSPRNAKVDALFARWDKPDSGGCAVSVIEDGKVVHAAGYGMADVVHAEKIMPATVFHVASLSKQFTAAAILKLAKAGKLSIDDPVRKHLPEVPDFGTPITLRHLLTHTSGLRDQVDLLHLAGWRLFQDRVTDGDVMALVERQKELNFPPGTGYSYSNTNFTLLAQVVGRVAKQPFVEFTQAEIFKPLGMTASHFRNVHGEVVKNLAVGYWTNDRGVLGQSSTNYDTVGATSLLTTVEDLTRWDAIFHDPPPEWQEIVAEMQVPAKLADGTPVNYGLGLRRATYRGLDIIGHTGFDAGYYAELLRLPAQRFTAISLCNHVQAAPWTFNRQIVDLYLESRLAPPPVPTVPPEALARRVGLYFNPEGERLIRVTLSQGKDKLRFGGFAGGAVDYQTLDENRFADAYTTVQFAPWPDTSLTVHPFDEATRTYRPIEEQKPTEAELAAYAGTYWSDETEYRYTFVLSGAQLQMKTLKRPPQMIQPVAKDLFNWGYYRIRFVRDAQDRVTGMKINSPRTSNLAYTKVADPKP
jgi:CubicO group peptidase (beta-lactamase class C family)